MLECGREESNLHPRKGRGPKPRALPFRDARIAPPAGISPPSGTRRAYRPPSAPCPTLACIPGSLVAWHHTPYTYHPWSQTPPPSMRTGNLPDLASADVFQRLLKERIIFLGSAIDDTLANLVCCPAPPAGGREPRTGHLAVHQLPGRLVTDGLAIYDTMQYVSCDVRTICMGLAASMGQFLLCAGAPGKRSPYPTAGSSCTSPLGRCRARPPTSPSRPSRSST